MFVMAFIAAYATTFGTAFGNAFVTPASCCKNRNFLSALNPPDAAEFATRAKIGTCGVE
jgi:hypothetical protein